MVGRGNGRKSISRLFWASALALAMLVLVPLASASAAPSVAITQPGEGAAIDSSTPTIEGTTDYEGAGVVVNVYTTTEPLVPVETLPSGSAGGVWDVSVPSLSDGTYNAIAEQTNGETSERGEATVSFTIDTVAPSVSLNAVAPLERDSTPTFTGSLGTASGDDHAVSVFVYQGSTATGTLVASGQAALGPGSWFYTAPSLPDGTYTVLATQADAAGNVGSAGPATFKIDTTPPAVSLNAGSIAALSNNPSPAFSGAAGVASGDAATVLVVVHKGTNVSGPTAGEQTVPVESGGWHLTPHLADGTYTVQAIQLDQAGNQGTSNTATFTIDTTSPTLTITSPKAGDKLKFSKPTFSGTTTNGGSEPVGVTVEIASTETPSVQTFEITRSGSSWTTGSSGPRLPNGTYKVHVREADAAGNVGESPAITFVVESPAPTVTLDLLPGYTNDQTPSFAGNADTTEAKPEVTLKIWQGTSASGKLEEATTVQESGGVWNAVATKALPDGTYTAQAEQLPEANNPAGVSGTSTFVVDTIAPTLTLSAPATSTGLETVSGVAGAAAGDRQAVTLELFNGSSVGESDHAFETLTINRAGGSWSGTFANLPSGEYAVIAKQSDEAGNAGESNSSTFVVTAPAVSTPPAPSAPSPPSASFTWVPAAPSVGQSVSLVSSSTDPSSAISSFAWDVAGDSQFAAGGPAMTTSFASPGLHSVSLRVSDGNGLSSAVTETIKVAPVTARLMQPFPIVRIAGSETSSGATVRLLTVQAPVGAKVSITCVGGGCKTKAESRVAKASSKSSSRAGAVTLAFARFERPLRAGASLQIRVTQAGEIGKFTSFAIRRKRLPVRTDACLQPASSRPSACPTS